MSRRIRRAALGVLALLATVLLAGAAFQSIGEARDRRAAPAPGRMVRVDGHRMHLHCTGAGSPTVVLEAGSTGFAQTWAWIQADLAPVTRVCSYDRPGMGWSDSWATAHDGHAIAGVLHTLLETAGEHGPYVGVGHSLGGPLARIFAQRYPAEVVGVVQIDPSHEEQLRRFPPEMVEMQTQFIRILGFAPYASSVGLLRLTNVLGKSAAGLPERDYRTARMFVASGTHLRTSREEMLAWDETMRAVREGQRPSDLPLLVISATEMDGAPPEMLATMHQMHRELAGTSTRGEHHFVEGSDHFSLLMRREHARETSRLLRDFILDLRAELQPL